MVGGGVGAFTYVVPLAPEDDDVIICINLVLLMGWLDSPMFFHALSETLENVANTLVNTALPIPAYGAITKIPATAPSPPTIDGNYSFSVTTK